MRISRHLIGRSSRFRQQALFHHQGTELFRIAFNGLSRIGERRAEGGCRLRRDDGLAEGNHRERLSECAVIPKCPAALRFHQTAEGLGQQRRFHFARKEQLETNGNLPNFYAFHGGRRQSRRRFHAVKQVVDDGRGTHGRIRTRMHLNVFK